MKIEEKAEFLTLVSSVMDYYRQDVSPFTLNLFWEALKGFEFEQVSTALNRHAMNPDNGQFAPKVADIVRGLSGTTTDKARVAWGKVFAAMGAVGAYQDIVFDDGLIHLVIGDMGGWVKICQTETDKLSYTQHTFCETYRSYAGRGAVAYPPMLDGINGSGQNRVMYEKRGIKPPEPVMYGDKDKCNQVRLNGTNDARGVIGFKPIHQLLENIK
jgi:hypothetical protein